MTGIVWVAPPYFHAEDVAWSDGENSVWDISSLLQETGAKGGFSVESTIVVANWRA
jgi:hypothetical protein